MMDHPMSEEIPILRTTCLLLPIADTYTLNNNKIDDNNNTLVYPPGLDPMGYLDSISTGSQIPQSNFVTLPIRRQQQQQQQQQQQDHRKQSATVSSSSDTSSSESELESNSSTRSNNVDEYFTTIPQLVQRCTTFLSQPVIELNVNTIEPVLYVGQREIAHIDTTTTTANKNLLLVSDRATTCHILVLRSYTVSSSTSISTLSTSSATNVSSTSPVLCSVAHLDSCSFSDCIRSTLYRHGDFHHQRQQTNQRCDEGSCNNSNATMVETQHDSSDSNGNSIKNTTKPKVIIDIHIVGGFLERNNSDKQQQSSSSSSSQKLSNWLLHLLADIAHELFSDNVTMILQTIAISCMNTICEEKQIVSTNDKSSVVLSSSFDDSNDNNSNSYPIGRSIAINCTTGHVFLARCTRDVMGPAIILRSVRLWSSTTKQKKLIDLCCNTTTTTNSTSTNANNNNNGNEITIQPFYYQHDPYLYELMKLPDHVLLQYCSTSPHCEEDDFCLLLREIVQFLSTIPYSYIFSSNSTAASRSTMSNQKSRTSILGCVDDDDDNTIEMGTDNNVASINTINDNNNNIGSVDSNKNLSFPRFKNRCKQNQQKKLQQQPQEQQYHPNPKQPIALLKRLYSNANNKKQQLHPLVFQRCQVQINCWRLVKSP